MCFIRCHCLELLSYNQTASLSAVLRLSGLPDVLVRTHTDRDLSALSEPLLPCDVLNLDDGSESDRRDKDIFTLLRVE